MTFDFYQLNTIRWNDQDRRRLIDMTILLQALTKAKT